MSERVAIVAAMETEVRFLVAGWRRSQMDVQGISLSLFERDNAALLCSGIGHDAGLRAAEALVSRTNPVLLMSIGFAGALRAGTRLGDVLRPAEVINGATGGSFSLSEGTGAVVSSPVIAGVREKEQLAQRFPNADAVDMEGAAVAEVAARHGLRCVLVKAISDEMNFAMPPLGNFIDSRGQMRQAALVGWALPRPWVWPPLIHLARNSALAARRLAAALEPLLHANGLKNLKLTSESRVY